jgi:cobaltochelatase CobS
MAKKPAVARPSTSVGKGIDIATVNGVLKLAGLAPINEFEEAFRQLEDQNESLSDKLAAVLGELESARSVPVAPVTMAASGEIPALLGVEMVPAWSALGLVKAKDMLKFEVPVFRWDGAHPNVPPLDPDYVFRPNSLLPVLMGLLHNSRPWLHGHTGVGKTSLVEAIAARLNWPTIVISMDSEIGRMDLMGRDTLVVNDAGQQVSRFVEGVLPQWIAQPAIICMDEVDFGRPDVMYVLQRALDEKGLLLAEDGGRLVQPHRYSRIVATANTKGGGDDTGLYPGARVQSAAFLNRFQTWVHVDYMHVDQEAKLLKSRVPSLPEHIVTRMMRYVAEHREAFQSAQIMHPLSPRNIVSMGRAYAFLFPIFEDEAKALKAALESTVLNAASAQDATVLEGIAVRALG